MFVHSNDLFYGSGIALSGDVTAQIQLWDAGTEVNQAPGVGADQAPRQSVPDTGAAEAGTVKLVDDGFSYPSVGSIVKVTVELQEVAETTAISKIPPPVYRRGYFAFIKPGKRSASAA
jgi:hypothetical protein